MKKILGTFSAEYPEKKFNITVAAGMKIKLLEDMKASNYSIKNRSKWIDESIMKLINIYGFECGADIMKSSSSDFTVFLDLFLEEQFFGDSSNVRLPFTAKSFSHEVIDSIINKTCSFDMEISAATIVRVSIFQRFFRDSKGGIFQASNLCNFHG